MKTTSQEFRIGDTSVHHIKPLSSGQNRAAIILLHGFGCHRATHLDEAVQFAARGFGVYMPDALLHGSNALEIYEMESPMKKIGKIDEIYRRTADFIPEIIQYDAWSMQKKGRPVGIAGISMGGCSLWHYLSGDRHPQVKAASIMLASPFWANHLQSTLQAFPDLEKYLPAAFIEAVRGEEPSTRLDRIRDIPLLLQCGQSDPLVPLEDIETAFAALRDTCPEGEGELLRLLSYPNIGHSCIPAMFDQSLDWLAKHLSNDPELNQY